MLQEQIAAMKVTNDELELGLEQQAQQMHQALKQAIIEHQSQIETLNKQHLSSLKQLRRENDLLASQVDKGHSDRKTL